ncbi:uncharacterized protein LOC124928882 [Impatiens glandulifera]|uniref:uncharacterized protein LOC124928882 n=1 Tax=Impatiens glandulifera TaxID=253017 RepID=UPI001FB127EB|nr:uncharacterized protein LOC124928882 [Impatiens glandulifera]
MGFTGLQNGKTISLGKVVSDVSMQLNKLEISSSSAASSDSFELEQAECGCCGLKEECTTNYITQIKNRHSGIWVCGLCSEAVKERRISSENEDDEEAIRAHKRFYQEFNCTTRANPKLSLAFAMRTIARRSFEERLKSDNHLHHNLGNNNNNNHIVIARSSSCMPRIDLTKQ